MKFTDEQRRKLKNACTFLREHPMLIPLAFQQLDEDTRKYFESLSEQQRARIEKAVQKKES